MERGNYEKITYYDVLFIINLVAIIIPLWSSENTMIILYRMAIFCNLAVFVPSITLIYREKGKTQ